MLLQAFVLARWNERRSAWKKCPTLMLGLNRASTGTTMAPPVITLVRGLTRVVGMTWQPYTWSAVSTTRPECPRCYVTGHPSLSIHWKPEKVPQSGVSRALCRAASVELSLRAGSASSGGGGGGPLCRAGRLFHRHSCPLPPSLPPLPPPSRQIECHRLTLAH